jgi:hypothetical protein
MKTFLLLAVLNNGQSFALDTGLSLFDCGSEIAGGIVYYVDESDVIHPLPADTSFLCEAEQ